MAWPSVAEVKSDIGIGDSTDDVRLSDCLDAAKTMIEHRCGQSFTLTAAVARTFAPTSYRLLVLPVGSWIGDTTSLVLKTDDNRDGVFETTWAATDYQLEPLPYGGAAAAPAVYADGGGGPARRIRAISTRMFPMPLYGRAVVEITAKWGWAVVPAPIKRAAVQLTSELFKAADAPFGVAAFGDFGPVRVGRFNPIVERLIAPYCLAAVVV